MSADLHARLTAAVEDRLARARVATPGPWWTRWGGEQGYIYASQARRLVAIVDGEHGDDRPAPNSRHIAANAPDSVIRHCERDLKVLERHHSVNYADGTGCLHCELTARDGLREWPCDEILDLAEAYGITTPAEQVDTEEAPK